MPNKGMEQSTKLKIDYTNARDKVVEVWERFDDKVPDDAKPKYRQLMLEYLLDMFGSWVENGDSLPHSQTLHFLARLKEKQEGFTG